ncbi:MAG: hypothetical protein IIT89_03800, partial [Aeriscardovia sp.]|nr:hypothetical protein [Aeriscardovia sp.]
ERVRGLAAFEKHGGAVVQDAVEQTRGIVHEETQLLAAAQRGRRLPRRLLRVDRRCWRSPTSRAG